MAGAVHELRVFMASPGDLTDERETIGHVEQRINATFDRLNVRVRITGWEQVSPELGRPQELINPLVHDCDIFVGLLNRRWGSETGLYSSGFEEEFAVALARRADGPNPAIGMFFADIPAEALADPGPQLQSVLDFQKRVREEHVGLYRTFRNGDHLAFEILGFLTSHLVSVAEEADLGPTASGSSGGGRTTSALDVARDLVPSAQARDIDADEATAPAAGDSGTSATGEEAPDDAQRQIAQALHHAAAWFELPDLRRIHPPDYDRVTLVGNAFGEDLETLSVHHVQRLYKRREDLVITVGEAYVWYRTYFVDYGSNERDDRTVPIWGMIEINHPRFLEDLVRLAVGDNRQATLGCLRFTALHHLRPAGLWPPRPDDSAVLKEESEDTAAQSDTGALTASVSRTERWRTLFSYYPGVGTRLNYLVEVATADDVPFLTSIAAIDGMDDESRLAVIAVASALKGTAAPLAKLAPSRYAHGVDKILDLIAVGVPDLDVDTLGRLLADSHPRLGRLAALELAKAADFSGRQLDAALSLHTPDVENAFVERASADTPWGTQLVERLQANDKFEHATLIARGVGACCPTDVLEELNKAEKLQVSAWEALMVKDPNGRSAEAREVLDGISMFIETRTKPLRAEYKAVAEHIANTARRVACDALARSSDGNAQDVARVASELRRGSSESRESALQALISLTTMKGDGTRASTETAVASEELARVVGDLSVLDDHWASRQVDAVLGSRLASLVVPIWRRSEISGLRDAARRWELSQPGTSDADLEAALYLPESAVRMGALDELLVRWDNEQLVALLDRYGSQRKQYWYNVIAALDEHLYGYSASVLYQPS